MATDDFSGRVPAEPGSRASTEPQSSQGLGPSGFDPSRAQISIAGPFGKQKVLDAWVFASLAVHPALDRSTKWTLTHIATGCSIGCAADEGKALDAAREIETKHSDALSILNRLGFAQASGVKGRPPAVKRLLATLEKRGLR